MNLATKQAWHKMTQADRLGHAIQYTNRITRQIISIIPTYTFKIATSVSLLITL